MGGGEADAGDGWTVAQSGRGCVDDSDEEGVLVVGVVDELSDRVDSTTRRWRWKREVKRIPPWRLPYPFLSLVPFLFPTLSPPDQRLEGCYSKR